MAKSLRVEMHCHTRYSFDGLISFAGLTRMAVERKLDAICVTDHDTIEGALEFKRLAQQTHQKFEIIIGEERTLKDGTHIIGLFLHKPILADTLAGVVAEIHEQGGLVLAPHPFRKKDGLLRNAEPPYDDLLRGIDAFELHNSKISHRDNERARGLLGRVAGVFGGSDAHYESDVARCVCELFAADTVENSIRAMLTGQSPYRILGVPQTAGGGERRYAPWYYRIKPYLRIPKFMVPSAKQVYRWYWNKIKNVDYPELTEVYHRS